VLEDRFHAHVLRTPTEVRNCLRYVRGNHASHAAQWGEKISQRWVDPCSSEVARGPRGAQATLWPEPVTKPAETWLLRNGAECLASGAGR
jgi:hypothetical protein